MPSHPIHQGIPYNYKTLPSVHHVRVLQLRPGVDNDPLQCSLLTTSVKEAPPYSALSYVWGGPATERAPVICDGKEISVTINLIEALHRLRLPKETRTVWADAVCINQKDFLERAQQVSIMPLIYEHAQQVLIWAGTPAGGTDMNAFNLIREVNDYVRKQLIYKRHYEEIRVIKPDGLFDPDDKRWKVLAAMFQMPWFERLWVLQEVGLAASATLYYGALAVRWSDIVSFADVVSRDANRWRLGETRPRTTLIFEANKFMWLTYENKKSWRSEIPYVYESINYWNKQLGAKLNFFTTFATATRFNATEPRDHLYAILGHPTARELERSPYRVPIDYEMPIDKLRLEFARAVVSIDSNLEFLTLVQNGYETPEKNPPSWAPHLGVRKNIRIAEDAQLYGYCAGSMKQVKASTTAGGQLMLTGVLIDTITWCSEGLRWINFQEVTDPENLLLVTLEALLDPKFPSPYSFSERIDLTGEVLTCDPRPSSQEQ